jgi:hypothetical protein
MSRTERRTLARETRKQATAWPARLAPIPSSEWPPHRQGPRPIALWRSRAFLVQMYAAKPLDGVEVRQLTVNRVTLGVTGHWDPNISWDELQACKRETGHGDWYAVEVYPRDRDLVHVANMRHLWLLAEPLGIGWFSR